MRRILKFLFTFLSFARRRERDRDRDRDLDRDQDQDRDRDRDRDRDPSTNQSIFNIIIIMPRYVKVNEDVDSSSLADGGSVPKLHPMPAAVRSDVYDMASSSLSRRCRRDRGRWSEKFWLAMEARFWVPFLRRRRATVSSGELGVALVLICFILALMAEPVSYAVSFSYCAEKKSAEKCADVSYRVHKLFEKMMSFIHPIIGVLFLPITKNSIFAALLGTSFERAIAWHRFLGKWMVVVLTTIHSVGFLALWAIEGTLWEKLRELHHGDSLNLHGLLAFFALVSLFVFSLDTCRRRFYNLFRVSHILFAVVFLLFVGKHYDGEELVPWLTLPLILLLADVAYRIRQACYLRVPNAKITHGEQIGARYARIRFRIDAKSKVKFNPTPGQWAFISIPCVSGKNPFWKPLSIVPAASSSMHMEEEGKDHSDDDDRNAFELFVACSKKRGAWSSKLFEAATEIHDRAIFIDGPYGSLSLPMALHQYDSLLLIAGGVGITAVLSMLPLRTGSKNCRRVPNRCRLVWAARDEQLVKACAPHFAKSCADINITLTTNRSSAWQASSEQPRSGSTEMLLLRSGEPLASSSGSMRPNIPFEVSQVCSSTSSNRRRGWRTAVIVCGPVSMIREAENACHELQANGASVSLHKEIFEW